MCESFVLGLSQTTITSILTPKLFYRLDALPNDVKALKAHRRKLFIAANNTIKQFTKH